MKHLFLSALMALTLTFGLSAENKTAVFSVNPKMSCQNCENKIKSNLRHEKGIKNIETSLADQTVTVTYDDAKTDPAKIAAGFKKIGYAATEGGASSCPKAAKACAGSCKDKSKCTEGQSCSKDKSKCTEGKSCSKDKSECTEGKSCCKDKTKCTEGKSCCKDKSKCTEGKSCCKDKSKK